VLTRHFGRQRVLYAMLVLLAGDLAVMAWQVEHLTALIVATVVAGLFLGVLNTVLTESVMEATELPRSVASSIYSGIRFVGGAVAPAVAGVIAARLDASAPDWGGAAALLASVLVLVIGRRHLAGLEARPGPVEAVEEATVLTAADA
jgi:ACDE family multidrug resistance protein